MVAVALPDIRSEFGTGITGASFLVTSYLVAVAVAQPLGGRLGDALGHVRVLRAALVLMGLFSVLAALATSFPLLIAARSAQGLAAALLMPNSMAYLRKRVPAADLAGALGAIGVAIGAGAAAGPLLGGLIVAVADWRWMFAVNIPLAAAASVGVWRVQPDEAPGRSALRVHWLSLAALVGAFTGLALLGSGIRAGAGPATGAAALGLGGIALYAALYRRQGDGAIDLRLFTRSGFAGPAALVALFNIVMYTTLIAVPVFLDGEPGFGDGKVGLLLFALSASMLAASPAGGNLAGRFGPRSMMVSGAALQAGAVGVVVALISADAAPALLALPLVMMGLGQGLATPAQQATALASWPPSVAGSASGALSLSRYVGSVSGAALFAAMLGGAAADSAYMELFSVLGVMALAAFALSCVPLAAPGPEAVAAPSRSTAPAASSGGGS